MHHLIFKQYLTDHELQRENFTSHLNLPFCKIYTSDMESHVTCKTFSNSKLYYRSDWIT